MQIDGVRLRDTPDFIAVESTRHRKPLYVVETKTAYSADRDHYGEEWSDDVNEGYRDQCIWHCGMTGAPHCVLAVQFWAGDFPEIYIVQADEERFNFLVKSAIGFWKRFVDGDETPPIDKTAACRRNLSRLEESRHHLKECTDEQVVLFKELRDLKLKIDTMSTRKNEIENQLIQEVGEYKGIDFEGGAKFTYAALNPQERLHLVKRLCESLGLNPLTNPFQYIRLNGRLTLYATKGCTDQLRRVHGVSIEVLENVVKDGRIRTHVRATVPDERQPSGLRSDEDFASVSLGKGNDALNNEMKAITKAKRRVTLSIVGLGLLDESELETIPKERIQQVEAPAEVKAVLMPPKKEEKPKAKPKKKKARTPAANKKSFVGAAKAFAEHGVTEEQLLAFLGIEAPVQFTEPLAEKLREAYPVVARGQRPKGLGPAMVTCSAEVPAPPGQDMAGVE